MSMVHVFVFNFDIMYIQMLFLSFIRSDIAEQSGDVSRSVSGPIVRYGCYNKSVLDCFFILHNSYYL